MKEILNFLPGPVPIPIEAQNAFMDIPYSHRSDKFKKELRSLKRKLCTLTGASRVALFSGSGTLANEVIASELSKIDGNGIILSNGEFGNRIIHQAKRHKLSFNIFRTKDGKSFDLKRLSHELKEGRYKWLWFVHSETSSGILNDLTEIKKIGKKFKLKICVDCISSIGNTPLNLKGVFLASASSNKGLASYPGISIVFYREVIKNSQKNVPIYIDLLHHGNQQGIPFTISSNLIASLNCSLNKVKDPSHFQEIRSCSEFLERKLSLTDIRSSG